jgi:type IV secretion system protein TrbG
MTHARSPARSFLALSVLAGSSALLAQAPGPVAGTVVPPSNGAALTAQPAASATMPDVAVDALSQARHYHWRPLSPAARSVMSANRAATQEPGAQGFVNATQVFPFAEGALFHIYAAPGQVTDLALENGENLISVAAGDTVRWVIGDTSSGAADTKRTHVLIKPFSPGLMTNAVITTDRRVYHVSLTSTVRTAMAAVSWSYPQDQLLALKRAADAAAAAAPVSSGLDLERLHFGYALAGDKPDWRPLRAFDDGRQTFIEFPTDIATGTAPPLFVIGPDKRRSWSTTASMATSTSSIDCSTWLSFASVSSIRMSCESAASATPGGCHDRRD